MALFKKMEREKKNHFSHLVHTFKMLNFHNIVIYSVGNCNLTIQSLCGKAISALKNTFSSCFLKYNEIYTFANKNQGTHLKKHET